MIEFWYSEEEDIVRVNRSGVIDKSEILNYIDALVPQYNGDKRLKILTNSIECTLELTEDDYPEIIEALAQPLSKFLLVKKAILVNDPKDVALSFLFEQMAAKLYNFSYKTFSDEESAIEWLNQA